jgi:hypothetical protein
LRSAPDSRSRICVHHLVLRRGLAEHPRLLLRELLDLAADLRAQRATAALERLELAHVRGHLALEPRGAVREAPRLLERVLISAGASPAGYARDTMRPKCAARVAHSATPAEGAGGGGGAAG